MSPFFLPPSLSQYQMMQEFQSEGFVVCDLKPYDGAARDSEREA